MRVGDYVQVTRRMPPRIRRGSRGMVDFTTDRWAFVDFGEARDWVHIDHLAVIVKTSKEDNG